MIIYVKLRDEEYKCDVMALNLYYYYFYYYYYNGLINQLSENDKQGGIVKEFSFWAVIKQ